VLADCLEDAPPGFAQLARRFVDAYTADGLPLRERAPLLRQIELLERHTRQLEKELREREKKHKTEKTQFCQEADQIAGQMEEDLIAQERLSLDAQAQLHAEIAELRGRLATEARVHAEYRSETESELAARNREAAALSEDLLALREENERLKESAAEQAADLGRLREEYANGCDELRRVAELLDAESSKGRKLRQKLRNAKDCNAQVLQELRARNDSLTEEYASQLENFSCENTELKASLLAKIAELESHQQNARQLRDANVDLQAKQQTLKYRVDELTKALERERESGVSKQKAVANSVKVKSDAVIDSLTRTIEKSQQLFVAILRDEFAVPQAEQTIDGVIEQIACEIAKRAARNAVLEDCFKVRRALGFDSADGSLVDAFSKREAKLSGQQKLIEELECSARRLRAENDAMKAEAARLEQYKPEITQWTNWSRRLLGQLCGPKAAVLPVADVRMLLEEACLSSVGSRSLTSKLAILRDEKKLLTSPRISLRSVFVSGKLRKNGVSVRAIVVTFLALRRIQRMSGFLPVHYGSQNEAAERTARQRTSVQRK
jgi:myosin heavy subunit